jgi:ATP-dependent Clp protease ATP-binding subunit ClpB
MARVRSSGSCKNMCRIRLAEKILLGEVGEGAHVTVSAGSDRLVFSVSNEKPAEAEAPQGEAA